MAIVAFLWLPWISIGGVSVTALDLVVTLSPNVQPAFYLLLIPTGVFVAIIGALIKKTSADDLRHFSAVFGLLALVVYLVHIQQAYMGWNEYPRSRSFLSILDIGVWTAGAGLLLCTVGEYLPNATRVRARQQRSVARSEDDATDPSQPQTSAP